MDRAHSGRSVGRLLKGHNRRVDGLNQRKHLRVLLDLPQALKDAAKLGRGLRKRGNANQSVKGCVNGHQFRQQTAYYTSVKRHGVAALAVVYLPDCDDT